MAVGTSGNQYKNAPVVGVLMAELIEAGQVRGPMVHDARVAAICLGHGVDRLWTTDRDFSRFPALAVHNPLVGRGLED